MTDRIDRRDFLTRVAAGAAGAAALGSMPWLAGCGGDDRPSRAADRRFELAPLAAKLAVARSEDARVATLTALDALGGAKAFVRPGDRVALKPNMAWTKRPEFAANTNPVVVATLAEAFLAAGAGEVRVFDRTCPPHHSRRAYQLSGIADAVEAVGGEAVVVPDRSSRYRDVRFEAASKLPEGKRFETWPIFAEALDADLLVNVPVAKQHGIAQITLGLKNLMGVMGGDRGDVHTYIQEAIALLGTEVRPHLTVLDASRMLVANGPTGGRLEDVVAAQTIVAGVDIVAVDAWAVANLPWRKEPYRKTLTFLDWGGRLGVGEPDLAKVTVLEG